MECPGVGQENISGRYYYYLEIHRASGSACLRATKTPAASRPSNVVVLQLFSFFLSLSSLVH